MSALGIDPHRQALITQSPLHEGRGKYISCSGSVHLLARAEGQAMGRLIDRHRVCPRYFSLPVPEQKGHMFLQVIKDGHDTVKGKSEFRCYEFGRQGFPGIWQFPDDEMMDASMVLAHEIHRGFKLHLLPLELFLHVHEKRWDAQHILP
jgi:hypothetical protein